MIVVLDTSVIVSALLSPSGPPAEIILRWEAGEFDVAVSPSLITELERLMNYPRVTKYLPLSQEMVSAFIRRYAVVAFLVEPQIILEVIIEDPADNRIIECAAAADAAYIVTGDKHLLNIKEFKGIIILSPSSFLALLHLKSKIKTSSPLFGV
jgi:putative PIN family toxin of toxin-antitoxin system